MWIYSVILTIVGLLWLVSLSLSGRQGPIRFMLTSIAIILLTCFMGFRDRIGADWDSYAGLVDAYRYIKARDVLFTASIEPCYAILNYLASVLGGGIYLINIICGFLMLLGIARFAYLVNLDACLTLFLATPYLVFAVGMGYTRQSVAIGIGFAALGYWTRGKRHRCYACIILATGFHLSAVFLFLLLAMKTGRRAMVVLPAALVCASLIVKVLLPSYLSLYIQNTQNLHSSGVWLRLAIVLIGVLIFILQRKRWKAEPEMFRLLSNASVLAVFLVPVAVVASTLADRVCLYLFFVYLTACGRAIGFSTPVARYLMMGLLVATTYGCFFLWFAVSPYAASSWIPYHSVLFDQSNP